MADKASAVTREDRARQHAMDSILKLREGGTPIVRCAELAGTSKNSLNKWRRFGDQLLIADGRLSPDALEGTPDLPLPKSRVMQEQCVAFAISWRELEKMMEPRHLQNIRKCAEGYIMEVTETRCRWKPGRGKNPGQWVPYENRTMPKIIPADWRASLKLLEMADSAYRQDVGVSVELRREAEAMSDEELHSAVAQGFALTED